MKWSRHIRKMERSVRNKLFLMIAAEALLMIAGIVCFCPQNFSVSGETISFFAALLLNIAVAVILNRLLLFRMETVERQKIEIKSREDLRSFMLKQRTQRHDFNVHLMALSGMLDGQRYQEMRNYLDEMLNSAREVSQLMPLDDPAVSAMLNRLIADAKKRGITVECLIYYSCADICCNGYELNMILSNLIRNSCDAVETAPQQEKNVTVTILKRRGQCILRVENWVPKGTRLDDSIFRIGYSQKKGHSGIGLPAVQDIVKSYHGTVFFEQENSTVSMIVKLPLIE